MPLPPGGSTLYRSGIEIENSTYRSAMAMDFQFMPMRVRPFLLLGGSHPYPEQIRICLVDSFDYRPIVLFRKLRLIGWRIGFHFDVGIIHFHTLFYQCIIRKTKRFAIPERAVYFLKTKRTAGGTPPPQNIFDRLTPVFT